MGALFGIDGLPILTSYGEALLTSIPFAQASNITSVIGDARLALADVEALIQAQQGPQWGLFKEDGTAVLSVDTVSVLSVSHRKEYALSDFPIEEGGFGTYNKVRRPYNLSMVFAESGSREDKSTFLQALDDAVDSLDLLVGLTPEVYYANLSLVDYEYRRERDRGANIFVVEARLQEVRIVAAATYSSNTDNSAQAKDTAAANQQDGGTRSPNEPTALQKTNGFKQKANVNLNVHAHEAPGGI